MPKRKPPRRRSALPASSSPEHCRRMSAGVTHRISASCLLFQQGRTCITTRSAHLRLTLIHVQRSEYMDRQSDTLISALYLPLRTATDSFLLPTACMLLPDNHAATRLPQPLRRPTQNRRLSPLTLFFLFLAPLSHQFFHHSATQHTIPNNATPTRQDEVPTSRPGQHGCRCLR